MDSNTPLPLSRGELETLLRSPGSVLKDFADATGVAAALAGEELGAGPHLTGYLATYVADFLGLQWDALGIGDEDGEVLDFVLNGIGILSGTGGTANDGHGFASLDKGDALVDLAGGEVAIGFVVVIALDADAAEMVHDFIDMVGVDGIIDGDVPVVIVEVEGLFEHYFRCMIYDL